MKPFLQITLSPSQGLLVVGLIIVVALAIFVVLPAVPRAVDKNAGRLITQARVAASSGSSLFHSGGAFYRFSVYEKHLVVCFLAGRSYSYTDIRLTRNKSVQRGQFEVHLDGVRFVLTGNAESLDRLAKALSERLEDQRIAS